jgi:hypothetical protein
MKSLHQKAGELLGKTYAEMPCYRMLELLSEEWPPKRGFRVGLEHIEIGDCIAFGDEPSDALDLNATIGIYLGSGKVIACTPETGVRIFPWRFVKRLFLWGVRVG